jgi:hypothetical protein
MMKRILNLSMSRPGNCRSRALNEKTASHWFDVEPRGEGMIEFAFTSVNAVKHSHHTTREDCPAEFGNWTDPPPMHHLERKLIYLACSERI